MKRFKYCTLFITSLLLLSLSQQAFAQKNKKVKAGQQLFQNMVDSQHFIFVAQTVNPLRGNFRNLTSPYDVKITKDSLVSELPYFGRAYNAAYGATQSPLNFISTSFAYTVTPHKKDGWYVTVKPKDKMEIQQYTFTIYNNGKASLNVISTSRDAITFDGYINKK